MKKVSLTEQLRVLKDDYSKLCVENNLLKKEVAYLAEDRRWLKQLIQEMSATMNNGSREGSFPRR